MTTTSGRSRSGRATWPPTACCAGSEEPRSPATGSAGSMPGAAPSPAVPRGHPAAARPAGRSSDAPAAPHLAARHQRSRPRAHALRRPCDRCRCTAIRLPDGPLGLPGASAARMAPRIRAAGRQPRALRRGRSAGGAHRVRERLAALHPARRRNRLRRARPGHRRPGPARPGRRLPRGRQGPRDAHRTADPALTRPSPGAAARPRPPFVEDGPLPPPSPPQVPVSPLGAARARALPPARSRPGHGHVSLASRRAHHSHRARLSLLSHSPLADAASAPAAGGDAMREPLFVHITPWV